MPKVYIDTIALAAPPEASDASACQEYLHRLLDLRELRDSSCADIWVSRQAPEVLATANRYPLWGTLPHALVPHRVDIMRILDSLLSRTTTPEEVLRISYALLEDARCSPDTHLRDRDPVFVDHHHHLLALMWVHQREGRNGIPLLFTTGVGGSVTLRAMGQIVDVEYLEPAAPLPAMPCQYDGAFFAADRAEEIVIGADPWDIWKGEGLLEAAILAEIARYRRLAGQEHWPLGEIRWQLGSEFIPSATRSPCFTTDSRGRALLRACAETILGIAPGKTHALREGPGQEEPAQVRARDGARAMRRDIDYDFHLHYWATSNGPELAAVAIHEDYSIPE